MAFSELKHTLSCSATRICKEIQHINHKSEWSVFDVEVLGKLMFSMEKASKIMKMIEEVDLDMPENMEAAKEKEAATKMQSVDDKMISVLEDMAARAESDYEKERIKRKIDALRHMQ